MYKNIAVSIIIVNYKTPKLTSDCIASVVEHTKDVEYEIILVDNHSQDGCVELIKKKFPQVIIKQNHANLGFGVANNKGMALARGKYFFLLNSDCILKNNAVKMFYDRAEKNPGEKLGALGGYLLDQWGKPQVSYSSFSNRLLEVLKMEYIFLFPKAKLYAQLKNMRKCVDNNRERKVDYIIGADLFIPRSVLDITGRFDDHFFMYFEEQDLQYRMAKRHYDRIIIPGPQIIHLAGGTLKQSNKKRILYDQSEIFFMKKHNNPTYFFIFAFLYFSSKLLEFLRNNYTFAENKIHFRELIKYCLRRRPVHD